MGIDIVDAKSTRVQWWQVGREGDGFWCKCIWNSLVLWLGYILWSVDGIFCMGYIHKPSKTYIITNHGANKGKTHVVNKGKNNKCFSCGEIGHMAYGNEAWSRTWTVGLPNPNNTPRRTVFRPDTCHLARTHKHAHAQKLHLPVNSINKTNIVTHNHLIQGKTMN